MILLWCFLVTVCFHELCSSVRSVYWKEVPLIWWSIKDFPPQTVELLLTRLNISLIALVSHELMLQQNALSLWVWVWSSWSFILSAWRSMTIIHSSQSDSTCPSRSCDCLSSSTCQLLTQWQSDHLWGGRNRFTSLFISGRRLERGFSQTRGLNKHIQCHCDSVKEPPNNMRFSALMRKKMTSNYTKCTRKLILRN